MFRQTLRLALICLLPTQALAGNDIDQLLRDADNFRTPSESSRVETRVDLLKAGKLEKQRRYTVFIKPGGKSLVLFRHASEQGQKVLMLDDKFWMILPKSRRPIRITPMQKLLGEASTGDIAIMTWHGDYSGEIVGVRQIDGEECLQLDLTATRKGLTYQRILLSLAKGDHHPVRAELYVASGKLAKVASYTLDEADASGQRRVSTMVLQDRIQKSRSTVIYYDTITPESLEERYFNPAFLVRNRLSDLK